jgi:putative tryptophan/tyrosine transport system substrate-binding protein
MRRRQFVGLVGGAAAWPLAARAQQDGRVRRIGVLNGGAENDPTTPARLAALREELAKHGWSEGRNLRIDLRFGAGETDRNLASAADLVGLAPEVIVTSTAAATMAVQRQTQTIPIVITGVGDPIDNGIVKSLARPEGNTTGFTNYPSSIGGKWAELLKEAAPQITRVAVLFNPDINPNSSYIASIEVAAPSLAVQAIKTPIRDAVETVRAIDAFAAGPNGGLLVTPATTATTALRQTILQLAMQHRLPSIHAGRIDVARGGLLAYVSDDLDRFRGAASYVDRLLRGAKVSELPVKGSV